MSGYGFTGGGGRDDDEEQPRGSGGPFGGGAGAGGLGDLLGGLLGGGGAAGAPFFAELQKLLTGQGSDGPVNWELARQTAVRVAADGDTPVSPAARRDVEELLRLADLWLDPVTTFPAAPGAGAAWTRQQWVEVSLPVWRELCEPVAASVARATNEVMGSSPQLPAEVSGALGPLMGALQSVGGLVFGMQLGQALGGLAREVVGTGDLGVPLTGRASAALLPSRLDAAAAALATGGDHSQARLHLALREGAHARLFAAVPWLRAHVRAAVTDYAAGVRVDTSGVQRLMGDLDLSRMDPSSLDPSALQEALSGSGLFQPSDTPAQKAALARLETLLALVEGWVEHVVHAGASPHLPSAGTLRDASRARRASGGPAEVAFGSLVGLELRPRRLSDAARLWAAVEAARGVQGRDAVWDAPDDLPTAADLGDPEAFLRRDSDVASALAGLDEELLRLTGGDAAAGDDTPEAGGSHGGAEAEDATRPPEGAEGADPDGDDPDGSARSGT